MDAILLEIDAIGDIVRCSRVNRYVFAGTGVGRRPYEEGARFDQRRLTIRYWGQVEPPIF